MATSPQPTRWSAILEEARAALAAGQGVNREALVSRIRAVVPGDEVDAAVSQLDRVLAVARAKARLSREPAATPVATRPLRAALRTKPLLTANMEVRRESDGGAHSIAWERAAGVSAWEIRIAERPDARSDYATVSEATQPADETRLVLPLGDKTLRIHILGRARDGRLLRRAVVTGLSRENWDERWQKRASAS